MTIRATAQVLTWTTAAFCVLRGLPVLIEGWKYFAHAAPGARRNHKLVREAA